MGQEESLLDFQVYGYNQDNALESLDAALYYNYNLHIQYDKIEKCHYIKNKENTRFDVYWCKNKNRGKNVWKCYFKLS
jgi:hypothetical protein